MTLAHSDAYQKALDFWFKRVNFELAPPQPDDLKLERIRALLGLLGDPHERLRIIHVAGSKGKGSTSAMLAAILRQAGYRTGLFTSPHLGGVEERVQVDDRPIGAEELTALLQEIQAALAARPLASEPTFFEIATALGFLHFVRRRVDAAVIEVGLGGRWDSTNVCRPLVSIITSISLDHTRQLGDRLGSIAMEKAGIVKPYRPVISGATALEAREVIERICKERHAPLRRLGIDFHITYTPGFVSPACSSGPIVRRARVQVHSTSPWPPMELNLLGKHQAANAGLAVVCVEELRSQGWTIPDAAVIAGLEGVEWPARMEIFGGGPQVVVDCAHNVASVQALVEALHDCFPPTRRLLVFAASADKDLAGMLRILAPHFQHIFLTRYGSSQRAAAPEALAELLRPLGTPFTECPTAATAMSEARAQAGAEDVIVVTGSVFLAGEVRAGLVPTV